MGSDVRIKEWLTQGFDLFKANAALLILAGLIAVVLTVVTAGVLGGPMAAGMALIVLRLLDQREPKPEATDVFKGFDVFLQSLLLVLALVVISGVGGYVLGLLPYVGTILSSALGLLVGTLFMFAIFLIAERKMEFWPAMMESLNVVKGNFGPFLLLYCLASLIGGVGVLLCFVGVFVTLPIYMCILTVAYRSVFGGGTAVGPVEYPLDAE